ncbi:MAG: biliverdin-producing heme oxygenase [Thermoanaerobaculia bacterium]
MDTNGIMERLRTETRYLHDQAEQNQWQGRMVSGDLTRSDYTRWLGQMFLGHRALESQLRSLPLDQFPYTTIRSEHFQEPYLRSDLEHFGVDPETIEPLAATTALIARIEELAREQPLALLGFHYVLEGSNNGNRFIAKRLREVYELEPGAGDRYLDPYGERQREVWKRFKEDLGSAELSAGEQDLLVASAREMFQAIYDISNELDADRETDIPAAAQ